MFDSNTASRQLIEPCWFADGATADIRLVWANCEAFNEPGSPISQLCLDAEALIAAALVAAGLPNPTREGLLHISNTDDGQTSSRKRKRSGKMGGGEEEGLRGRGAASSGILSPHDTCNGSALVLRWMRLGLMYAVITKCVIRFSFSLGDACNTLIAAVLLTGAISISSQQ